MAAATTINGSGIFLPLHNTASAATITQTLNQSRVAASPQIVRRPRTITGPLTAPSAAAGQPATKAVIAGSFTYSLKYVAGITLSRYHGRKVARAATHAPASPATKKPMNATVITTGPGVMSATATASRNCWSSSQPNSLTTPPYR